MRPRFPGIERDFRYTLTTGSGFTPLFFLLSTEQFVGFAGFQLPHGVVHLPDTSTAPSSAFVSYPSVPRTSSSPGNGAVVEFNPEAMIPNQASTLILRTYR
jgi:hypothetical protein